MIATLLLTLGLAQAAEPAFSETKKDGEAVEKPESKLTAEFGGALTTGNSEFYLLTAGLNASHKWKRSKFMLVGTAVNGSATIDADGNGTLSDGERAAPMSESARRAGIDARYDFFLSDNDSLYVSAGAFHDKFAKIDYRLTQQLGYSRSLIKDDDTNLLVEGGLALVEEGYPSDVDPRHAEFVALRALVGFSHKFSEGVGFENRFEAFENLMDTKDFRFTNTASLVSALSSKFSLKLSHQLLFDNVPSEAADVPDDERKRKIDQTMQVTLVASIL